MQPTDPHTIPGTNPATNLTSTIEIQLEGRLVASRGVDAMVGRSSGKPTCAATSSTLWSAAATDRPLSSTVGR